MKCFICGNEIEEYNNFIKTQVSRTLKERVFNRGIQPHPPIVYCSNVCKYRGGINSNTVKERIGLAKQSIL